MKEHARVAACAARKKRGKQRGRNNLRSLDRLYRTTDSEQWLVDRKRGGLITKSQRHSAPSGAGRGEKAGYACKSIER